MLMHKNSTNSGWTCAGGPVGSRVQDRASMQHKLAFKRNARFDCMVPKPKKGASLDTLHTKFGTGRQPACHQKSKAYSTAKAGVCFVCRTRVVVSHYEGCVYGWRFGCAPLPSPECSWPCSCTLSSAGHSWASEHRGSMVDVVRCITECCTFVGIVFRRSQNLYERIGYQSLFVSHRATDSGDVAPAVHAHREANVQMLRHLLGTGETAINSKFAIMVKLLDNR
jgi:hypothetical protein